MQEEKRATSQQSIQSWIGLLCAVGMLVGFILSRSLLSISMIVLFANSFWPKQLGNIWRQFQSQPFALCSVAYFVLYVISGLWSDDKSMWWQVIVLKLPFLIMPIGMWSVPFDERKFRNIFIAIMLAVVCVLMLVSITLFISDWKGYVEGYWYSRQIPTTKYGDHIRLGLILSFCIIIINWLLQTDDYIRKNKIWKTVLWIIALFIIIYLHLLSAKTGLMALYIVMAGISYRYLSKKWNKPLALIVPLLSVVAILFLAYFTLPTFKSKIEYVKAEITLWQSGQGLDHNYSDLGRLISYHVTMDGIEHSSMIGCGAGDVQQVMNTSYDRLYPIVPPDARFVPINQYLTEVLTFGWILSLVYLVMIVVPFFSRQKSFYLSLTTFVMIAAMMVEAMLQIQAGIYVYLFFTMWWMVIYQKKAILK